MIFFKCKFDWTYSFLSQKVESRAMFIISDLDVPNQNSGSKDNPDPQVSQNCLRGINQCCGSLTFWYGSLAFWYGSGSADPLPLTNGSGSGLGFGSGFGSVLLFSSVTLKIATRKIVLLITFWSYISIFFSKVKITSHKDHKTKESRFSLLFLLDDRRIRIRTSDQRIRIRESQKHADPTYLYPDQQHCWKL